MSIDVQAFRINSDGNVTQNLADADYSGGTVSGILRLAQRFINELCTEKDSIPYKKGRGCLFVKRLRERAATEADVFTAFAAALVDVRKNLGSEETATDPGDERFGSASVVGIIVRPGDVHMKVSLTSKTGSSLGLTLPLPLSLGD